MTSDEKLDALREKCDDLAEEVDRLQCELDDVPPAGAIGDIIDHCRRQATYAQLEHDETRMQVYEEIIQWIRKEYPWPWL